MRLNQDGKPMLEDVGLVCMKRYFKSIHIHFILEPLICLRMIGLNFLQVNHAEDDLINLMVRFRKTGGVNRLAFGEKQICKQRKNKRHSSGCTVETPINKTWIEFQPDITLPKRYIDRIRRLKPRPNFIPNGLGKCSILIPSTSKLPNPRLRRVRQVPNNSGRIIWLELNSMFEA